MIIKDLPLPKEFIYNNTNQGGGWEQAARSALQQKYCWPQLRLGGDDCTLKYPWLIWGCLGVWGAKSPWGGQMSHCDSSLGVFRGFGGQIPLGESNEPL